MNCPGSHRLIVGVKSCIQGCLMLKSVLNPAYLTSYFTDAKNKIQSVCHQWKVTQLFRKPEFKLASLTPETTIQGCLPSGGLKCK